MTSEIHTAMDRLNDALQGAEEYLYEMDLGARGDVILLAGIRLVWQKEGDRWGLYLIDDAALRRAESVLPEGGPTPILRAQASLRILAAGVLHTLLDDIRVRAAGELAGIDAAIEAVRAFAGRACPKRLCPECKTIAGDDHFTDCGVGTGEWKP